MNDARVESGCDDDTMISFVLKSRYCIQTRQWLKERRKWIPKKWLTTEGLFSGNDCAMKDKQDCTWNTQTIQDCRWCSHLMLNINIPTYTNTQPSRETSLALKIILGISLFLSEVQAASMQQGSVVFESRWNLDAIQERSNVKHHMSLKANYSKSMKRNNNVFCRRWRDENMEISYLLNQWYMDIETKKMSIQHRH